MKFSVIVPTYNEKDNIPVLAERFFASFKGSDIVPELVIVDDNSPDGTGDAAEDLKKKYNVKVVHRAGKLGLSSAVLEGFEAASGNLLGVIDADLSHPAEMPVKLAGKLLEGFDVAVGSRKIKGGGVDNWPLKRKLISGGATLLAKPLTGVHDPMSGLFAIKRSVIDGVELNPCGFKICLEILVKGKYDKVTEVAYRFVDRAVGQSKLTGKVQLNYVRHLFDLYSYRLTHL